MSARLSVVVLLALGGLASCSSKAKTFPLEISVTGTGTVISSPAGIVCPDACSASLPSGEVRLTALPDSQFAFDHWSGACSGSGPTCQLTLKEAETVGAFFQARSTGTRSLTVIKAAGSLGTISSDPSGIDCGPTCAAEFNPSTQVGLSPHPDKAQVFAGWSGDCSGIGACRVTMDTDRTVVATFIAPVQITPSVATVVAGCNATLELKPAGGQAPYVFTLLSGGGSVDAGTGIYTVPLTPGPAVVRLTDALGSTSDAAITVALPASSTWTTVDDFSDPVPGGSYPTGLTADASGNLYATGPSGGTHWLVRKSADDGKTWNTVNDFVYPASVYGAPRAIAADSQGNLYVGGNAQDTRTHSLVRKGTSGGTSWTTVDDFFYASGSNSSVTMLVVGPNDNPFVGHEIQTTGSDDSYLWLVRTSANQGASWSVSDSLAITPVAGTTFAYAVPSGFAADGQGSYYVVGTVYDGKVQRWTVRKSSNSGSTWSKVDDYVDPDEGPGGAYGNAIATTPEGRVVVAGNVNTTANLSRWIVRASDSGGDSWTNDDDYQFSAGSPDTAPVAILVDKGSTQYACGGGSTGVPPYHWIVRKKDRGAAGWSTAEDFVYPDANFTICTAQAVTPAGTHFAAGWSASGTQPARWLIRKETPICP